MKIETLEHYIKKTTIPYGDLLKRASKTLNVNYFDNGIVSVSDSKTKKAMVLFFEDETIYKDNKDNGLIKTEYNY